MKLQLCNFVGRDQLSHWYLKILNNGSLKTVHKICNQKMLKNPDASKNENFFGGRGAGSLNFRKDLNFA